MRLWKIIATATVVEGAAIAAFAAIAGLGGAVSGWLDLFNQLAPVWLALAVLSAPTAALLIRPGRARRLVVGLAVVAGLIGGAEILPEAAKGLFIPAGGRIGSPAALRIVTFNTWSDNADPQAVMQRVRETKADAVALIEMSWSLAHVGVKELAKDYPYRTPGKRLCPADMVLFSKRPFTGYGCQVTSDPRRPELTETIVWGRTTAPDGRPFTLATTHYAWPFPHGGQEMQRPFLARFVRRHGDADMILTGDFNLTPWSFALKGQDRDLEPLTRRTHGIPTWPAMIARLNRPAPFAILPIDQIYAGPAWRTQAITRLRRAGSDHYGLLATFSRRP